MPKKYEQPPKSGGNYLVLSLKEPDSITKKLKSYPTPPKGETYDGFKDAGKHLGDSTTVLWSGQEGNNTPLSLYTAPARAIDPSKVGALYTGYICDPSKLQVDQADFLALQSGGEKLKEVRKEGTYEHFGDEILNTKYKNKQGYVRRFGYTTNIAKFHKLAGSTSENPKSKYEEKGSLDIVAKNVWRRYHKYEVDLAKAEKKMPRSYAEEVLSKRRTHFNEAITYQKGSKNPIDGLLFVVDRADKVDDKTKAHFATLLKENPKLKLYFYNKDSDTHIMRVMNNKDAKAFIKTSNTLKEGYHSAKPFKGFGVKPNPVRQNSFDIGKLDQYITDRKAIAAEYTSKLSKQAKNAEKIYSRTAKLAAAQALKDLAKTLKGNPKLDAMAEIKKLHAAHPALTNGRWRTGKLNKLFNAFKAYAKKEYGVTEKKSNRPAWSDKKPKKARQPLQDLDQNQDNGQNNKPQM